MSLLGVSCSLAALGLRKLAVVQQQQLMLFDCCLDVPLGCQLFFGRAGAAKVAEVQQQQEQQGLPVVHRLQDMLGCPGGRGGGETLTETVQGWQLPSTAEASHPNPSSQSPGFTGAWSWPQPNQRGGVK